MADLLSVTQNVQRILTLYQLLYQVGNDVRHGQAHVAAHDVVVRQSTFFPDANAIERSHNGVRKLVLLVGTLHEILYGEFLEAVCRARRRTAPLRPFRCGVFARALENHARREHNDLLELALLVRPDGGIKGGSNDALIFRQQVVGKFVKVGDASNHGRGRDEMVTIGEKFLHESDIFCIALNQFVAGMGIVGLLQPSILAKVVKTDYVVPVFQEFLDQISTDKAGSASYQNFHGADDPPVTSCCGWGQNPHTSTTTLLSDS